MSPRLPSRTQEPPAETDDGGWVTASDARIPVPVTRMQSPLPRLRPAAEDPQGKTFGEYRILSRIARGAQGIVYKAFHEKLQRVVALKLLAAGDEASDEKVQRFLKEAKAAAGLTHPFIVQIHDVGEIHGRHFFTMDFVEGRTISKIIRGEGLPIRDALVLTKKIADALDYAHSQGIVHRDVKPANILIDEEGNPRITDFGMVKDLHSDEGLTQTGETVGTPAYIAPEQAMGTDAIDGRADIYSVGTILYELITSRPPFVANSPMEVLLKALKEDPTPPKSLCPSIHKDVETICLKALEKDPDKRYSTARELGDDIERYLNGETIRARPIGLWERLWRRILRNKAAAVAAAAAILAILGAAGFVASEGIRAERDRIRREERHLESIRRAVAGLLREASDLTRRGRQASTTEAMGLYDEAVARTREAAWKDPESQEARSAHFNLLIEVSRAAIAWEAFDLATSRLNEARSVDDRPDRLGQVEAEVEEARRAHQGYRDNLQRAKQNLAEGRFDGAIRFTRQAMEISRTEEAAEILRQARTLKGIGEGDGYLQEGRYEEAITAYEATRPLAQGDERTTLDRKVRRVRDALRASLVAGAREAGSKGERGRAASMLERALEIDPDHRISRVMLADLRRSEEAPEGMIYVPSETFALRDDAQGDPILGSFYIDRCEVSNRQYREFLEAGGYQEEALWDTSGWEHVRTFTGRDGRPGPQGWSDGTYPEPVADHPVAGISWYEARAYARWRGMRLPTAEEWEKVARASPEESRTFPWGDAWDPSAVDLDRGRTVPVDMGGGDETSLGALHLGGNVSEWVIGEGSIPLAKGASFLLPLERYARCDFRGRPPALHRSRGLGFRCVRDVSTEGGP